MILTDQCQADWQTHVLKEYPKEAVAYVIDDKLYPVQNVAEEPERTFVIDMKTQFEHRQIGTIQALLHSHPYKIEDSVSFSYPPEWPSQPDMQGWIDDPQIAWGIVSTDGEGLSTMIWMDENNPEPLEGREFIHGINDCYSVIRDWYKLERGITLINVARSMDWWLTEEDFYMNNFKRAGFNIIKEEEATIGDCLLMTIDGHKISHAAVITGPNQILHHLLSQRGGRLSGYDSQSKWHRQTMYYVRYYGTDQREGASDAT